MSFRCVLWGIMSTVASILALIGFYFPYWIQGRLLGKADAYFSSFRRCNYPRLKPPSKTLEIVYECAQYYSFWDIPSPWWQASTVAMGIGVSTALFGTFVLLAAVCSYIPELIRSPKPARILGAVHLIAATLISTALALYPIGWDNQEVRDCCGKAANVYNLGKCSLSWSSYVLACSVVLLNLCFALSFYVTPQRPARRQPEPMPI